MTSKDAFRVYAQDLKKTTDNRQPDRAPNFWDVFFCNVRDHLLENPSPSIDDEFYEQPHRGRCIGLFLVLFRSFNRNKWRECRGESFSELLDIDSESCFLRNVRNQLLDANTLRYTQFVFVANMTSKVTY